MSADLLAEKIPDAALRQYALDSSDQAVSVIIELAVPDPQIEYAEQVRHGEDTKAPVRVKPMSGREEKQLEKVAAEAEKFLDGLLDEPPVYLRSARAFIATVTGSELGVIAQHSFTKRIEANRSLPPRASSSPA